MGPRRVARPVGPRRPRARGPPRRRAARRRPTRSPLRRPRPRPVPPTASRPPRAHRPRAHRPPRQASPARRPPRDASTSGSLVLAQVPPTRRRPMPTSTPTTSSRAAVVRLLAVLAVVTLGATLLTTASNAEGDVSLAAVPRADCGPGSRPETSIQGRVPAKDYDTGRAQKGYTCNTRQVSHYGGSGGFKVFRYVDRSGRACAFYDSTLLSPSDVPFNVGSEGTGVVVLDMSDPRRPKQTANLVTPAMQSPHESLMLNKGRGLLVAVLGNPATNVGQIDVYDVKGDCRSPKLLSTATT